MQLRVRRIEPRPRPDLAPGVTRDEVLEVGAEVRCPRDRGVDVLVSEHVSADGHPPLVGVVAHPAVSLTIRGERPVDERLRGSEVRDRVEQLHQLLVRQRGPAVRTELVRERPASLGSGPPRCLAHDGVRLGSSQRPGEGERDPFRKDGSVRQLEVPAHPRRVELEPADAVRDRPRGSARIRERTRQSLPLRVPVTRRTLVLMTERTPTRTAA